MVRPLLQDEARRNQVTTTVITPQNVFFSFLSRHLLELTIGRIGYLCARKKTITYNDKLSYNL